MEADLNKQGAQFHRQQGTEGRQARIVTAAQGTRLFPSSSMRPSSAGWLDAPHFGAPIQEGSRKGEGNAKRNKLSQIHRQKLVL